MQVKILCTLDNGKEKFPPGSVVEVDKEEGFSLIRNKHAVPIDLGKVVDDLVPTEEDDDPNGTLHEEDIPEMELVIEELKRVQGITDEIALAMYTDGIYAIEDVANMTADDIRVYADITKKKAKEIISTAKAISASGV